MIKLISRFFKKKDHEMNDVVTIPKEQYELLTEGYIVSLWMHLLIYQDAKTHVERRGDNVYYAFNFEAVNKSLEKKGERPLLFPIVEDLLSRIQAEKINVNNKELARVVEHFKVTWIHSDLCRIADKLLNIRRDIGDIAGEFMQKL